MRWSCADTALVRPCPGGIPAGRNSGHTVPPPDEGPPQEREPCELCRRAHTRRYGPVREELFQLDSTYNREPQWPFGSRAEFEMKQGLIDRENARKPHTYGIVWEDGGAAQFGIGVVKTGLPPQGVVRHLPRCSDSSIVIVGGCSLPSKTECLKVLGSYIQRDGQSKVYKEECKSRRRSDACGAPHGHVIRGHCVLHIAVFPIMTPACGIRHWSGPSRHLLVARCLRHW